MNLFLAFLLLFPRGQQVLIDLPLQDSLGLPSTVENTYLVYSFSQAKALKLRMLDLEEVENKFALIDAELKTQQQITQKKQEKIEVLNDSIEILEIQSERRLKNYEKCQVQLKKKDDSPWPVVALAVGVAAFLGGGTLFVLSLR